MAQLTDTMFSIDGNPVLQFTSFALNQSIFEHHQFTLICPAQAIDGLSGIFSSSRDMIGSTFAAHISGVGLKGDLTFNGIVTSVETSRVNGQYGEIIISGYSPTIVLDNGPHCKTWEQKPLRDIAQDVLRFFPQNQLSPKVQPLTKEPYDYMVQYKETAWAFLQRLSAENGEWLFWDGRNLILGPPTGDARTSLVYGSTLSHFNINLSARPTRTQYMAWDYQNSELYTSVPQADNIGQKAGLNSLGEKVHEKAQTIFSTQPKQWNFRYTGSKKQQDEMATLHSAMEGSKMVRLTGHSGHPGVAIGGRAEIVSNNVFNGSTEGYGEYIVTAISHFVDTKGDYRNEFTAIPSSVHLPPVSIPPYPVCEVQSAIVTDNHDPQGLGRVRVRFHWMNGEEKTPWIRVVSAHAGGGKGVFFIPELEEEVIIGFEGDNSVKPYVMGTVYHGRAGNSFGNPGNDVKTIQTRSGTKIRMDDAAGSVFVEDPSGNTWLMDGNGNISVHAPNNIRINAGQDIQLNAGQNMEINVGNDFSHIIGNKALLLAMNQLFVQTQFMQQFVSNHFHTQAGTALINTLTELKFESPEMYLAGEKKLFLHSDTVATLNSKGKTEIKGAEGNAHTNTADKFLKSKPEKVALAVVHFRPETTYAGEFGFDWLRVDDNGLTTEPAYEKTIEGGYSTLTDAAGKRRDLTSVEAFTKLKKEYLTLTIERKPPPAGSPPPVQPPSTEYFVPYLTLFSREFVNTLTLPAGAVKPKYEATLRVLVDIEENLDKLEFDFDTKVFSLDKTTLSDKNVSGGLKQSADNTIKITCLKDFDQDSEIRIYAYPQGIMAKSKAEQLAARRLAGKIRVLRNGKKVRRQRNFALVGVDTNINAIAQGRFKAQEKINLYNALHQALIVPTVVETTLDLSAVADFQAGGKHIDGMDIAYLDKNNHGRLNPTLYPDVQKAFFNDKDAHGKPKNEKYKRGYFTIFVFGIESNMAGTLGAVQDIGKTNVIMFTLSGGGDDCTLNHETFHGLGLCHTHRDSVPLHMPGYRYIYPNAIASTLQPVANPTDATDNIMSYQSVAITSWHWQWKIINSKI